MKEDSEEFENQVNANILNLKSDETLKDLSRAWLNQAARSNYTYNFRWMNRPIIQIPHHKPVSDPTDELRMNNLRFSETI